MEMMIFRLGRMPCVSAPAINSSASVQWTRLFRESVTLLPGRIRACLHYLLFFEICAQYIGIPTGQDPPAHSTCNPRGSSSDDLLSKLS